MSYSIESAIDMLAREAERAMYSGTGSVSYQRAKDMVECAADARKELRKLREEMPRLLELKATYARAYDARVTTTELREDGDSAVDEKEFTP